MIEVQTRFIPEIFRRFCWFNQLVNLLHRNLKKTLTFFIPIICVGLLTALREGLSILLVFLAIAVLIVLLIAFLNVTVAVKSFCKTNSADITQTFRFGETGLTLKLSSGTLNTKEEVAYDSFERVYETKKSFYCYNDNLVVYLLPKSDFTQGTPEALRQLFKSKLATDKFKIYH